MNSLLSKTDIDGVLDILVEQLGVEKSQLTPQARLEEDLGADSLDKVEIMMTLDERYHVSIPDEVAEQVSTVEDVLEALSQSIGKP